MIAHEAHLLEEVLVEIWVLENDLKRQLEELPSSTPQYQQLLKTQTQLIQQITSLIRKS